MSSSSVKRVTLSLPPKVVSDMDFVAKHLGASRSAFISALLSESLPSLIPLAHAASKGINLTESENKRYTGEFSSELDGQVKRLLDGVEALNDDMFSK